MKLQQTSNFSWKRGNLSVCCQTLDDMPKGLFLLWGRNLKRVKNLAVLELKSNLPERIECGWYWSSASRTWRNKGDAQDFFKFKKPEFISGLSSWKNCEINDCNVPCGIRTNADRQQTVDKVLIENLPFFWIEFKQKWFLRTFYQTRHRPIHRFDLGIRLSMCQWYD